MNDDNCENGNQQEESTSRTSTNVSDEANDDGSSSNPHWILLDDDDGQNSQCSTLPKEHGPSTKSQPRIKGIIQLGDFPMFHLGVSSCKSKNLRVHIVKNIQENTHALVHGEHLRSISTIKRMDRATTSSLRGK